MNLILFGLLGSLCAVAQTAYSPVDFGQVTVNGASSQVLSFTFAGLSQAPTFTLSYGIDFTTDAPVCTGNGSSCTVSVTFSPGSPGVRQDAVVVKGSNGVVIATQFLHGIGLGPLVTVSPAATTTLSLSGASISFVNGLAVDTAGDLYVSDGSGNRVIEVDVDSGAGTVVAGKGGYPGGYTGDGGPATDAVLNNPGALALDNAGNLYIADTGNYVVRRVDANTGVISTAAGNGTAGYSGDGGAATAAQLNQVSALATDAVGNLFIADKSSHVIRKIDVQTGLISTVAGTGAAGYSGDNGPAVSAALNGPQGVAVDAGGNLYISDAGNRVIRKVNGAGGLIATIAGTGVSGYAGDGGDPLAAQFSSPGGIAVDPAGNLFIADTNNAALRQVSADGRIITTTIKATYAPLAFVGIDSFGTIYTGSLYGLLKTIPGQGSLPSFSAPAGSSVSSPVYISNSGTTDLTVSAVTITGVSRRSFSQTNTCGTTLPAGATCTVSVQFAPSVVTSFSQQLTATLNVVYSGPLSPVAVSLSGTGTSPVSFSSSYLSFPYTTVGGSSTNTVTLQNVSNRAVRINSIALASVTPPYGFSQVNSCAGSLAPNASCQITVSFTPAAAVSYYGTLNISYGSPASIQAVTLSGYGAPVSLSISDSLNFYLPQSLLTRSAANSVYISNPTARSLTLSAPVITGPAANDYSFVSTCGNTLPANGSCYVYVYFSPFLPGQRNATLTVNDDAGPHPVSLSGTGVLPSQFEIINSATGKALGVADNAPGTIVSQSALNGSSTQVWRAVLLTGGFYQIANAATGKVMDVVGGSPNNGAPVQQEDYLGSSEQQWQFVPVDDVHFKIVNQQTGKVLDVPSALRAEGLVIQQWEFNGNAQQLWTLAPTTSYNIANQFSSKVLSVAGNSTGNGAAVQQSTLVGLQAQQWQLVPAGGVYYAVINRFTGKVLDVTGASAENGAPVQQYEYLGFPNQQWQIVPVDNAGTCEIVSRSSGKALEDADNSAAEGAPVQQRDYAGSANQQWRLSTVAYSRITGVASGKLLEGGVPPAHLRSQSDAPEQQWQIVTLPNHFVLIANAADGGFLEVAGSSASNGAAVQDAPYTGRDNQQWNLAELYNGSYAIVNKASGKVLDVTGYSTADGAPMQQYQFLDGTNQQWYIFNVSSY